MFTKLNMKYKLNMYAQSLSLQYFYKMLKNVQ